MAYKYLIINSDWRFYAGTKDGVPHFSKDFFKAKQFDHLEDTAPITKSIKGKLKVITVDGVDKNFPTKDTINPEKENLNDKFMIQYLYASGAYHEDGERPLICAVGEYKTKKIGLVQIKQEGQYIKSEVREHAIRRAKTLKPVFVCEIKDVVEGVNLRDKYILPDWILPFYNRFKFNFLEELAEREAYYKESK